MSTMNNEDPADPSVHERLISLADIRSADERIRDEAHIGVITRDEWERRYASQVRKRAGWTHEEADEAARVGAIAYEEQERACGNAVVWWGGPSGADNTPEDQADEEMSYWTDDGE